MVINIVNRSAINECSDGKILKNYYLKEELVNDFTYNKEQDDEGKRIEQCKKWKE